MPLKIVVRMGKFFPVSHAIVVTMVSQVLFVVVGVTPLSQGAQTLSQVQFSLTLTPPPLGEMIAKIIC